MTQDEDVAAGAQSLVAAQQRTQVEPGLRKENRDVVVMLRASFGWWPVGRGVSEETQASVSQYWATCPGLDHKQVLAPLEWFPASLYL